MPPPENSAVTAELFLFGDHQAVRLPAEFGFEGATEVYIWRNARGDVVLSRRPSPRPTWQDFMALRTQLADSDLDSFLSERQQLTQQRDPFGDATLPDLIGLPAGEDCPDADIPQVDIELRIPDLDASDQEPRE